MANYHDAKRLYQAYTLPEVIDILRRETTEKIYTENIKEFHYQAKVNLLNAQLRDWEENYESLREKCDKYEKEWHISILFRSLPTEKGGNSSFPQRVQPQKRKPSKQKRRAC